MTMSLARIRRGERLNGYSHWLGFALAIAVAALFAFRAFPTVRPAHAVGALVFALSAMVLYGASAMFHSSSGTARRRWARADHCAIYLLIAGSCTPFVLIGLSGWSAAMLLAAVWVLALLGIARELRPEAAAKPSLRLYVGMGWLCVLVAAPVAAALDAVALSGLVAGAAVYSLGTVFYRNRRGWAHAHGVWHLFVMGGTLTHGATIARLVL